jgi:hypothetical protein
MATFVSVSTDAFASVRESARTREPQVNIRRPLRGIQVKPNTYSVLKVKTASGADIPLFDSSSPTFDEGTKIGKSTNYANFLIQRINEQRVEKQQIIETFGEDYVYFFGERPRFLDVSGSLVNTADFNWKSEFWANYDQNLRGTKLVERNARVYFYFDDVVAEGYIVNAAAGADSMSPHLLSFQFQMFVTNYAILSTVGSVLFGPSDGLSFLTGTGVSATGLEPFTLDARRAAAAQAAGQGSPGGLTGFLATTSKLINDASFSIQSTLETIKNTFYGRPMVVPDGLGSQIVVPSIEDKAKFSEPPTDERSTTEQLVTLKFELGLGDHDEPVGTIMQPHEV